MFGKMLTDNPDDAPELLAEFFRREEITVGGKIIQQARPPLKDKPSRG